MRRRSNDVRYRAGAATHVGRVRTNNEDSYAVDGPLFAIADGMGGENAGEVASAMAVETLRARGRASADLVDAIKVANLAVFTRSIQDDASTGMGTTLTAALLDGDRLTLGHVGDSRGYLMRDGVVQRLTEDHTKVQELVRAGAITEEQARSHPQRSIITRALGTRPDIAVDTSTLAVRQGDRLLLCTDGLTGLLPDEEVRSILLGNPAPQQAADRLVEAALAAGGSDNVTAIVVDVEEPGAFPSAARPGLLFAVSVGAARRWRAARFRPVRPRCR